jgi:predicted DNA-binding transcriptional regulator AlpA
VEFDRLMRDAEIKRDLGNISNTTLWRLRKDGRLPKPHKINKTNLTPESEYLAARARLLASNDQCDRPQNLPHLRNGEA